MASCPMNYVSSFILVCEWYNITMNFHQDSHAQHWLKKKKNEDKVAAYWFKQLIKSTYLGEGFQNLHPTCDCFTKKNLLTTHMAE